MSSSFSTRSVWKPMDWPGRYRRTTTLMLWSLNGTGWHPPAAATASRCCASWAAMNRRMGRCASHFSVSSAKSNLFSFSALAKRMPSSITSLMRRRPCLGWPLRWSNMARTLVRRDRSKVASPPTLHVNSPGMSAFSTGATALVGAAGRAAGGVCGRDAYPDPRDDRESDRGRQVGSTWCLSATMVAEAMVVVPREGNSPSSPGAVKRLRASAGAPTSDQGDEDMVG
mmetsp:Transcript_31015/g.90126  ORF Transcript_31015/g.90126 Transcript_31015/m.90126 type:complete len:227 (-) Transcript_31015:128-808(-)